MEAQTTQAFDMAQLCDFMMVLRVVECQDGLSHMYDPPNTCEDRGGSYTAPP